MKTHIHARIPRVICPKHGVLQVPVPWSSANSRVTLMMERWALQMLENCQSVKGVATMLRLSWRTVWTIMARAVQRGQVSKGKQQVSRLCVDEKAYSSGQKYVTIVYDALRGCVEYVTEDRTTQSLKGYFHGLDKAQLEAIASVCMDMWPAYLSAAAKHVPGSEKKVVVDRFHVMKKANEAVDKVRKEEHRELLAQGDKRLVGTRNIWRYAETNLPERYYEQLVLLRKMDLKVGRAWAIKENLRLLWECATRTQARKFFTTWYQWAIRSQLGAMSRLAKMVKRHKEAIVNFCRHRLTNAVAEGLNSKIQTVKQRACGFRNLENFKVAIMFYCGKLQLYP